MVCNYNKREYMTYLLCKHIQQSNMAEYPSNMVLSFQKSPGYNDILSSTSKPHQEISEHQQCSLYLTNTTITLYNTFYKNKHR